MRQEIGTDALWQGRTPLAEISLEGRDGEGRMILYATPLGMYISVWIGGVGLRSGAVYRLARESEGKREVLPWFPPLYAREGEATRHVITQKVSPEELWGSRFLLLDQSRVVLCGSL